MEIRPNVIAVKLMKREGDGLGFLVKQRSCNPPVIVSDVVRGGAADQSGLIQVGDLILSVNGTSLETLPYGDALQVLRAVEVGKPTEIILRGPEGFATKLETTFTGTGIPKTVRITTAESPLRSLALSPARRLIKRITGNSHVKSIDHINAEALKDKETVSNGPLCTENSDRTMETPKTCSSVAVQTSPDETTTKAEVNGQCNGNATMAAKLDKTKLTLDTISAAVKRESVNGGNELGRPAEEGMSSRRNSTTMSPSAKPRFARMKNWLNDKQMTDTLHNKGTPPRATKALLGSSVVHYYCRPYELITYDHTGLTEASGNRNGKRRDLPSSKDAARGNIRNAWCEPGRPTTNVAASYKPTTPYSTSPVCLHKAVAGTTLHEHEIAETCVIDARFNTYALAHERASLPPAPISFIGRHAASLIPK
ncbi:Nitric oxide synthase, brain [Branchiostoma belcheri]|nr:Nitric oxide synthase, brain [Branchiostoma belcheri]